MTRPITILTLVVAMLAVPTTAFAQDDAATTQRPTATDSAQTDRPSDASTDRRRFEAAKERALATIAAQMRVLDNLASKVASSRFITDGHAAVLRGDIGAAKDAQEELARTIEAAENWAELAPLIRQIDDQKIAQVLAPKTHQVIVSDALVVGSKKLDEYAEKLESVIERFEEAGFDVDEAWRLLDQMNDQIAEGLRLADPVAENVIGLQASDWPEPARATLSQGRTDLVDAGQALRRAFSTGVDIVQFLRSLYDRVTDL